jgi:hypothetical protein
LKHFAEGKNDFSPCLLLGKSPPVLSDNPIPLPSWEGIKPPSRQSRFGGDAGRGNGQPFAFALVFPPSGGLYARPFSTSTEN